MGLLHVRMRNDLFVHGISYFFFPCFLVLQCKKYRDQFTDQQKLIYEEKLEASELFKDKKALYPSRYGGCAFLTAVSISKMSQIRAGLF